MGVPPREVMFSVCFIDFSGTEGNGVQVEFVMRQNQVWSIQGRIKIASRKTI